MNLNHKSFDVPTYKVLNKDEGIIEAIVSVFNNVDAAKERVRPGFFNDSLSRKSPKGVWGHDWTLPVAKTLEAIELEPGDSRLPDAIKEYGGLYIKGQFNLDTQRGREAFSDLSFGSIDEFSFGYLVTESEKDSKTGITDLIKGEMYEWSPVLVGCNPATALISAKDAKPAVEFKAQYLGDYVETSMTMAAIRTLNDALFYNVVYDAIWNYKDTPLEDRLSVLEGACNEFRDILLQTARMLLSGDSEGEKAALEAEAKFLRVLWGNPDTTKDFQGFSLAEKTLHDHSETVLATVTGLKDRLSALRDLRAKDGRTLSEANRQRLQSHHGALSDVCEDLKALLEETAPKASTDDDTGKASEAAQDALMRFQQTRARLLGVPV